MTEQLRSILVGTAGLSVLAAIALVLTLAREGIAADGSRLQIAGRAAVLAALVQGAHFAEEWATGFHQRFPELLGLVPWSPVFFVTFNLAWLAIWMLSIRGLLARRRAALFPLWFLGLAGVANGLAHPALSILTGGYFPGLLTAPFLGVVGAVLLRRLSLITADRQPSIVA